jgi:hypothetical protein
MINGSKLSSFLLSSLTPNLENWYNSLHEISRYKMYLFAKNLEKRPCIRKERLKLNQPLTAREQASQGTLGYRLEFQ